MQVLREDEIPVEIAGTSGTLTKGIANNSEVLEERCLKVKVPKRKTC